jgi:hypothetical protein
LVPENQQDAPRGFHSTNEVASKLPVLIEAGESIKDLVPGIDAELKMHATNHHDAECLDFLAWAIIGAPGSCDIQREKDMYRYDCRVAPRVCVQALLRKSVLRRIQKGDVRDFLPCKLKEIRGKDGLPPMESHVSKIELSGVPEERLVLWVSELYSDQQKFFESVKQKSDAEMSDLEKAASESLKKTKGKSERWNPLKDLKDMDEVVIQMEDGKAPYVIVPVAKRDFVIEKFKERRHFDVSSSFETLWHCELQMDFTETNGKCQLRPDLWKPILCPQSLRRLAFRGALTLLCIRRFGANSNFCKLPLDIVRRIARRVYTCEFTLDSADFAFTASEPSKADTFTQRYVSAAVNSPLTRMLWGSKNAMSHFASRKIPQDDRDWLNVMQRGLIWGAMGFCIHKQALMDLISKL